MSQRIPRFSYAHTLRDIGDGGFTGSTSAFVAATPRSRLFDDQSKTLCGQGDGDKIIEFEQKLKIAEGHPNLNRILIPAGHNYGLDRQLRFELNALDIPLADGDVVERMVPSSGLIDIEVIANTLEQALTLKMSHWNSGTSLAPGIGEIWWTQTVQPTTGTANGWTDDFTPTISRTRMRSGATFNHLDGAPRRRFSLSHLGISGDDVQLYDELMRRTGYGALPFWYEHPDSGDAVTLINLLNDPAGAGISLANGTLATATNGAPDGLANAIAWTSDSASVMSLSIDQAAYPSGAVLDLRNTILQFDIKVVADAGWLAGLTDFNMHLQSADPLSDPSSTSYRIAQPLFQDTIIDEWIRVQVDVKDDANLLSSAQAGVDLTNIKRIQFQVDTLATGKELRIANMRFIDKTKQPVLVEVVPRPGWKTHEDDGAVALWNINLEMIEVTT